MFETLAVSEIVEKYGPVQVVKTFENQLETSEDLSKGLVMKKEEDKFEIMNIFD